MTPSTSTIATSPAPTFQSLGVRTVINCQGTYTIISGSRALKQVVDAMVAATNHYVNIDELMDKVGQRLAELTGAEWGYVSCGCAAALAEVTAACIAGADPEKMARLPDTTGMKNEVIIQKGHRNSYDRAIRMVGAQMIEVVTSADLRAALSERTAMFAIVGDIQFPGEIPPAEMISLGQAHGIPTLVDAAAQRPDIPNRYLQMGADAVTYSGGKCLRGPQASGLVLGRKALLQAAFLNAAPHHGLGRPMKAGKEEIMGLLAAVEAWIFGRDHSAEWAMWEGFLEQIRASVADLPSLRTEVRQPGIANVSPTLYITWDPAALGCAPGQIHQKLAAGDPAILLHLLPDGLLANPYMMEQGDAQIVATRLRALFAQERVPASEKSPVSAAAASADLRGSWEIRIQYLLGTGHHAMALEQNGDALTGTYRAQYTTGGMEGRVDGQEVEFSTVISYPGNDTTYRYSGRLEGDMLQGSLALGEYGRGTWMATRLRP